MGPPDEPFTGGSLSFGPVGEAAPSKPFLGQMDGSIKWSPVGTVNGAIKVSSDFEADSASAIQVIKDIQYWKNTLEGKSNKPPAKAETEDEPKVSGFPICPTYHPNKNVPWTCAKAQGHQGYHHWVKSYKVKGKCYKFPGVDSAPNQGCSLIPGHEGPHSWEKAEGSYGVQSGQLYSNHTTPGSVVYDESKVVHGYINQPLYSGAETSYAKQAALYGQAYGMGQVKLAKLEKVEAMNAAKKLLKDAPDLPLPIQTVIKNLLKVL